MSGTEDVNSDDENKLFYEDSSCSPVPMNEIQSPKLDRDTDKTPQNMAQTASNIDVNKEVSGKEVECKEKQGYGDQDPSKNVEPAEDTNSDDQNKLLYEDSSCSPIPINEIQSPNLDRDTDKTSQKRPTASNKEVNKEVSSKEVECKEKQGCGDQNLSNNVDPTKNEVSLLDDSLEDDQLKLQWEDDKPNQEVEGTDKPDESSDDKEHPESSQVISESDENKANLDTKVTKDLSKTIENVDSVDKTNVQVAPNLDSDTTTSVEHKNEEIQKEIEDKLTTDSLDAPIDIDKSGISVTNAEKVTKDIEDFQDAGSPFEIDLNLELDSPMAMDPDIDLNKPIEETDATKALNTEDTKKTEESGTKQENDCKIISKEIDKVNTDIPKIKKSDLNINIDTLSVQITDLEKPENMEISIKTPDVSSNTIDEINKDENPAVHSLKSIEGEQDGKPEILENTMDIDNLDTEVISKVNASDNTPVPNISNAIKKIDAVLDTNTKDLVPTNLKDNSSEIPPTKDELDSNITENLDLVNMPDKVDDVLELNSSNAMEIDNIVTDNSNEQLNINTIESLEIESNSKDNKTHNESRDLDKTMTDSYIKTDHELNKPDAMLEIPSQELIDIDEAELSIEKTDTTDLFENINEVACDTKKVVIDTENVTSDKNKEEIGEPSLAKDSTSVINESVTDKLDVDIDKSSNNDDNGGNKDLDAKSVCKEDAKEVLEAVIDDVQPSTSKAAPTVETTFMTPDTSDEVPEVSDSLGLLAESSGRMMEDDDDDDDDDDGDDGDDYDQDMDESSNQVSPEAANEEDPNIPESEIARDEGEIQEESQHVEEELEIEQESIQFDVVTSEPEKTETPCITTEIKEVKEVHTEETAGVEDKKIEKESEVKSTPSPTKLSPSKVKKLEIASVENKNVVNIVDLEESSSEDDVQEVKKDPSNVAAPAEVTSPADDVTSVNIPKSIEIMSCSGDNTSEIFTKEGEVVINGVPKPPPPKTARLNTSEVTIKTTTNTESTLVIPETKLDSTKPKLGLEIFSLDSDDEETAPEAVPAISSEDLDTSKKATKCINYSCTSGSKVSYKLADAADLLYYDAKRRKRTMICENCSQVVAERTQRLLDGIKDMTPLFDLNMQRGLRTLDLVEISDSESEDEEVPQELKEAIGVKGAKLLEENLADLINDAWERFNLNSRLNATKDKLDEEVDRLDMATKEINKMLDECQVVTDKLRSDLYATFETRKRQVPAWSIIDTLEQYYVGPEAKDSTPQTSIEARAAKRRAAASVDSPAKKPAIPLGYTPLDESAPTSTSQDATPATDTKDDDKDISVVHLSVESAPPDLPPPGTLSRPPLRVGMSVYAMKNAFGPWLRGKIIETQSKGNNPTLPFTMCRVKFEHKMKVNGKVLPARCIAYNEPADVRMTIGTRLIGLFKDTNQESYYSGVVAEVPNPVNNYRYLVFFDDGYAQYVQHCHTRLVCECSPLVWEEVHPFSREFVREYLMAYPERPMVRLHEGQHLKTEWNGKWWSSKVVKVDASLAKVLFIGDGRQEWIYRGSTRLAPLYLELKAAERHRPRPMPRTKGQTRSNMPYVEYTRSDEQEAKNQQSAQEQRQHNEEMRRQRAVAKKSTSVQSSSTQQSLPGAHDTISSRVVYYTPKNAVKPHKMVPHVCSPRCKRTDVLTLLELRTYNPLAKPLLSGWERQIVRFKGNKDVMYRTPCGRRVRNIRELHQYLRVTRSELPVDLFDFHPATHCLAEFVLNKCIVGKKDLSHGKENVPVPCVNYYDDSLPEFCSYNTERTPTAGVPLNLDPEFLCGCDCTDDCEDKTKCACWKMTLEGARTIGLDAADVGYVYKRLPDPLPSGIYECNSRCKCKHTCLNRVAQHPLQLKLQVFKTLNRGWGIRALNDVPKGAFLCVYAGNLLTDATANLDGLNEGDEYLAELDYIEVVEQMKEGYEEDIPEQDKKLDKKDKTKGDGDEEEEEEESSSEEEDQVSKSEKDDGDFSPGYIGFGLTEFSKRLRRRQKNKDKKGSAGNGEDKKDSKDKDGNDDCITISDDEEIREPSSFTAQPGMGGNAFISKYRSVRTLFGEDEACYIMDAKVQGNIGRYLNHSCTPNVFVQNVFVDTHDPRFPWVAFFALSHIKAGTELTWNYNYDVGSVPGKILYCYCGAVNCRGRLL